MTMIIRVAALLSAGALIVAAQTASHQNEVRDRGRTPTEPNAQSPAHGHVGTEASFPNKPYNLSGLLVDASCRDRSSINLVNPPEPPKAPQPTRPDQGVSTKGISVNSNTVVAERQDALEHQVADMVSRQPDPTCAITGTTRGFSLLLADGRLLDLDEGGNTLAEDAVQSTEAGRSMLNGYGPGVKIKVRVNGLRRGDRLVVDNLQVIH